MNLLLLLSLSLVTTSYSLFEDQIGKFDWHQKYFGHVRFLINDLNQPKRILVGTRDNIVGAINSNTGAVLYRHVLESNANLLHLENYGGKQFLTISSHANYVKVRTFLSSNGAQVDEWSLKLKADSATEFNGFVYFIDTISNSPDIIVSTFEVKGSGSGSGFDEEDGESEKALKNLGTKSVKIGLDKLQVFETVGPYFICSNGKKVSIVYLPDGTVTTNNFEDVDGEVTEISGIASKDFVAIAFKGKSFVKIFKLQTGSNSSLTPIPYPSTAYFVTLSHARVEGNVMLFIARLETAHSITMDVLNDKLERMDNLSLSVNAKMLIGSLGITKGYCHNSQCGLIGFTKDELLFGTKLEPHTQAQSNVQITWTRQESLASTLAVETVDYPSEAEQSWNPYSSEQGVLKAFISRIKYEVDSIIAGDRFYTSNDDRFGVKKVIIFVTAIGKVVGMDGISGQILYTFILPEFSTFKDSSVFLYLQRPAKYAPLKPLASVVYPSSKSSSTILFPFNPIEGQHLDEPQTYPEILQTQMVLHGTQSTNFLKPIVLLDKANIVHTYPSRVTELQNMYFFLAEKTPQPILKGLVVKHDTVTNTLRAKVLWNLSLGNSELIGVHGKLPCEKIHSQGRVLPDRSVSYKYMNPNLVAVVTAEQEAGNINVFLVDAVSGAVIHSIWHKKSRGPVHVVHSEHWIVYSLFNEKFRRYEITSIELYEGQKQSNSSAFSSFSAPVIQPVVIKQSYIFPTKIEFMSYTRTEKGITNKDILLALPTGGILELPKFVMQPRLSAQHHQIHQDEDGVIHSVPYIPELPMPPDMIINYNQSVKRVRGIKTWPTRLESTCLVLVYGVDIFYTKVAPSKHFDVLKDDFDHWFITLVLAALCIGAYVTKRLSARKQLEQAWR